MKQNNALASKKIVVNNLLCFVQNNLRVLSPASICRLCDETYMPEEVNQAFNNLKLQVQTFDPLINVQPSDNSKLGILNAIVELFNGKVNTEVQFVSNNCNLPRMNSYRDMLSVTCVLDEIRELKQIIKEQNKHLTTAFCRLSNQFELFKLKQQSSQANHKDGDQSKRFGPQVAMTEMLASFNHINENHQQSLLSSEHTDGVDDNMKLAFPDSFNKADSVQDEGDLIVENSSKTLVPSVKEQDSNPDLNAESISSSLLAISTSKRNYKRHSCKICGYMGNLTDVTRHMRTHTGERPFSCPMCPSKFTLRGNMIKHLSRKHGTFLSRFPTTNKVGRPLSRKTKAQKQSSNKRRTAVSSIRSYSQQQADMSNEIRDKANYNDASMSPNAGLADSDVSMIKTEGLANNMSDPSFSMDFDNLTSEAELPTSTFAASSSLLNDISTASSAIATYNPMLHLQTNLQQDEALSTSFQAMDRLVTISGAKKRVHHCDVCGYSGTASDVTRHKRTHTGERPFACPICDVRFTLRGNMTKHILRIHPDHAVK